MVAYKISICFELEWFQNVHLSYTKHNLIRLLCMADKHLKMYIIGSFCVGFCAFRLHKEDDQVYRFWRRLWRTSWRPSRRLWRTSYRPSRRLQRTSWRPSRRLQRTSWRPSRRLQRTSWRPSRRLWRPWWRPWHQRPWWRPWSRPTPAKSLHEWSIYLDNSLDPSVELEPYIQIERQDWNC